MNTYRRQALDILRQWVHALNDSICEMEEDTYRKYETKEAMQYQLELVQVNDLIAIINR